MNNFFVSFIALIVIFFLFACGKTDVNPLPEELYSLQRTNFLQGQEAEEFVNRLHLKTVVSVKSEIAFYEGNDGPLTIYITYYNDEATSRLEMQKMTEKMQTTETVFIKGKSMVIGGQNVFRCFGMGQTHYIFTAGQKLFWVSAGTMIAADFIEYYLDYIN